MISPDTAPFVTFFTGVILRIIFERSLEVAAAFQIILEIVILTINRVSQDAIWSDEILKDLGGISVPRVHIWVASKSKNLVRWFDLFGVALSRDLESSVVVHESLHG